VADRSAYNASKHGLIGLTRTLAVEWGAKGVRVNAVCPGWVKTEMDHKDQAGGSYSDADIMEHVPMGRFAKPDDIAQAIAFLCDSWWLDGRRFLAIATSEAPLVLGCSCQRSHNGKQRTE
jgi:NAD(P)-dependent dehydrogenase (short-subunit alcohol dehydrogenase family)